MGTTSNLVLGGSGTIGTALCRHLSSIGEGVINLDIKEGFDLRSLDLSKYKDVDYVWFLAWDVGGAKYLTDQRNLLNILRNNIAICENVFQFLEQYQKPFLFTSSQLASPESTYGLSKLVGEEWTKLLGGKTVKFWNVYGWEEPGERSHVLPDLIMSGLQKKEVRLMTKGLESRQFIYMDDCVRALVQMRDLPGKSFDLTNGKWITILEAAQLVAQKTGAVVIPGDIEGYDLRINPDATHKLFNFETNLEEGIDRMVAQARAYISSQLKIS